MAWEVWKNKYVCPSEVCETTVDFCTNPVNKNAGPDSEGMIHHHLIFVLAPTSRFHLVTWWIITYGNIEQKWTITNRLNGGWISEYHFTVPSTSLTTDSTHSLPDCFFWVNQFLFSVVLLSVPSMLWRCWLGGRKGIWPVKNWVVGCWPSWCHCHSLSFASVKSRLVLVPAHQSNPRQSPKGRKTDVYVYMCVCDCFVPCSRLSWLLSAFDDTLNLSYCIFTYLELYPSWLLNLGWTRSWYVWSKPTRRREPTSI